MQRFGKDNSMPADKQLDKQAAMTKVADPSGQDINASQSATDVKDMSQGQAAGGSRGLDAGDWGYAAIGAGLGGGAGWLLGRLIHGDRYKARKGLQLLYALSGAGLGGAGGLALGKDIATSLAGPQTDRDPAKVRNDLSTEEKYKAFIDEKRSEGLTDKEIAKRLDDLHRADKLKWISRAGFSGMGGVVGWRLPKARGDILTYLREHPERVKKSLEDIKNRGLSIQEVKDMLNDPVANKIPLQDLKTQHIPEFLKHQKRDLRWRKVRGSIAGSAIGLAISEALNRMAFSDTYKYGRR